MYRSASSSNIRSLGSPIETGAKTLCYFLFFPQAIHGHHCTYSDECVNKKIKNIGGIWVRNVALQWK